VLLDVLVILVAASIFYGFKLGGRSFENHDHDVYACIASTMMETGDWLVMRIGENLYTKKPHLLFWSICLFSIPAGKVTPLTARLPCVLGAVGSCVVTFLFARTLFNRRAAYLASFMLMGTWAFSWNARRIRFDTLLTFFTVLALFLLYTGYKRFESTGHGRRYYVLAGFAIALAILLKGPIGGVLVLVPFGLFLIAQRNLSKHARNVAYTLIPILVIISPWLFVYVRGVGSEALLGAFSRDTMAHFLDKSDQGPRGPFYYYFVNIPLSFVPWSIFFPVVAVVLYRSFRKERRENFLFLIVWIASVLVLLSAAYSKASRYSFPIYPALAMIVAGVVASMVDDEESIKPRARRVTDILAVSAAVGMSAAVAVVLGLSLLVGQFRHFLWISVIFGALIAPFAAGLRRSPSRQRLMRGLTVMILFMLYFNWAHVAHLVAHDDKYSPMKVASGRLRDAAEDGRLVTYNFASFPLNYYTSTEIRKISSPSGLDDYMSSDSPVYCLIGESDLSGLPDATKRNLDLDGKTELEQKKGFFIVSNKGSDEHGNR
jgi:4-amino-4-deoxy-L-arabinose transferase-like glycosyltransferase